MNWRFCQRKASCVTPQYDGKVLAHGHGWWMMKTEKVSIKVASNVLMLN